MEVHHHSHSSGADSHRSKKKWTHYLWEFLMLFLAVFCGFMAENFREHQVEHQREKQYMKTFIVDLQSDTSQVIGFEPQFEYTFKGLDTLMAALKANEAFEKPEKINNCFGYAKNDIQFTPANRTIEQLKNSGNMRLIRKPEVSDSLAFYDQLVDLIKMKYEIQSQTRKEVLNLLDDVIDENTTENSTVINRSLLPISNPKKLIITDRHKLDVLFNKIKRLKGTQMDYYNYLELHKEYCIILINLLKRKYHL